MSTTPFLDELSKALAYKIFDPVNSGTSDGNIFTKEHRLGYINRAYGKLVRTLEIIHPRVTEVIKDYFILSGEISGVPFKQLGYYELPFPCDVKDLFYHDAPYFAQDNVWARADYIDPANYESAKLGLNIHYQPSQTYRVWTLINKKIYMLPVAEEEVIEYTRIKYFAKNSFPNFDHSTGTGARDLFLSNDYMDILILMAAIEAMADKGEQVKYQLYTATLNAQLQLIDASKKMKDIKEEGTA